MKLWKLEYDGVEVMVDNPHLPSCAELVEDLYQSGYGCPDGVKVIRLVTLSDDTTLDIGSMTVTEGSHIRHDESDPFGGKHLRSQQVKPVANFEIELPHMVTRFFGLR